MDRQEVFDTVVGGVLKQGGPSIDSTTRVCRYLHHGTGRRCAAGQLLTPEEAARADALWADSSWSQVVYSGIAPERLLPHNSMITKLQLAHDTAAKPESGCVADDATFLRDFTQRVKKMAARYKLEWRFG